MRRSFKHALLAVLLIAVVPLQGYAALGVELCHALAGGEGAVDHGRHGHHASEAALSHHDGQGLPDGGSAQDSHHCAACASCGVAAAISAAPGLYASDSPHQSVIADSLPEPKGHVPERLDRPPLKLLV